MPVQHGRTVEAFPVIGAQERHGAMPCLQGQACPSILHTRALVCTAAAAVDSSMDSKYIKGGGLEAKGMDNQDVVVCSDGEDMVCGSYGSCCIRDHEDLAPGFASELTIFKSHLYPFYPGTDHTCMSAGASLHQQASWQHHSVSEGEAAPTSNGHSLEYSAPGATADGLTFHTPPIGGRSPSAAKAASTSPDPFAPATPDHAPALPPCKVNPLTDFHSMLASQEDASCGNAALSSFQKLLGSRDVNQQARLSRFQELLASQEVEQDGQALSSLAGRVRGMAAQLNVLQKRTQVRPAQERHALPTLLSARVYVIAV